MLRLFRLSAMLFVVGGRGGLAGVFVGFFSGASGLRFLLFFFLFFSMRGEGLCFMTVVCRCGFLWGIGSSFWNSCGGFHVYAPWSVILFS